MSVHITELRAKITATLKSFRRGMNEVRDKSRGTAREWLKNAQAAKDSSRKVATSIREVSRGTTSSLASSVAASAAARAKIIADYVAINAAAVGSAAVRIAAQNSVGMAFMTGLATITTVSTAIRNRVTQVTTAIRGAMGRLKVSIRSYGDEWLRQHPRVSAALAKIKAAKVAMVAHARTQLATYAGLWAKAAVAAHAAAIKIGGSVGRIGAAMAANSGRAKKFASAWMQAGRDVSSAVSRVAAVVGGAVGVVGGLAIKSGIAARAIREQLTISFQVLTQSVEKGKRLLEELREFAAKTPLRLPDIGQAAKTLLQFGVPLREVMKTIQQLGDVSAGDPERFKSMALAFGQMSAAGRLMGQDLLQMINAGFNPLQEISARTGESILELKKRMEAGGITAQEVKQAFADATGPGGRFFGMMSQQAQTFNGLWSTFRDRLEQWLDTITGPLFEQAKSQLQGLVDGFKSDRFAAFTERIRMLMSRLSDSWQRLLTRFTNGDALGTAERLLTKLITAIVRLTDAAAENWPAIQKVAGALGKLIAYVVDLMGRFPALTAALLAFKVAGLLGITTAIGSLIKALGATTDLIGGLAMQFGAGATAAAGFKAAIAAVVAYGLFKLVQWLTGATEDLKKFNDEMARSAELELKINAKTDERFQETVKELESINDARQKELAIIEQIQLEEKNLAGLRGSAAGLKKQAGQTSNPGSKIRDIEAAEIAEIEQKAKLAEDRVVQLQLMLQKLKREANSTPTSEMGDDGIPLNAGVDFGGGQPVDASSLTPKVNGVDQFDSRAQVELELASGKLEQQLDEVRDKLSDLGIDIPVGADVPRLDMPDAEAPQRFDAPMSDVPEPIRLARTVEDVASLTIKDPEFSDLSVAVAETAKQFREALQAGDPTEVARKWLQLREAAKATSEAMASDAGNQQLKAMGDSLGQLVGGVADVDAALENTQQQQIDFTRAVNQADILKAKLDALSQARQAEIDLQINEQRIESRTQDLPEFDRLFDFFNLQPSVEQLEAFAKNIEGMTPEILDELLQAFAGVRSLGELSAEQIEQFAVTAASRVKNAVEAKSIQTEQQKDIKKTVETERKATLDVVVNAQDEGVDRASLMPMVAEFVRLREQVKAGAITLDEFRDRADGVRQKIQAVSQAQDQFGSLMEQYKGKLPGPAVQQLQANFEALKQSLINGDMSLEEFTNGVKALSDAAAQADLVRKAKGQFTQEEFQQGQLQGMAGFQQAQFQKQIEDATIQRLLDMGVSAEAVREHFGRLTPAMEKAREAFEKQQKEREERENLLRQNAGRITDAINSFGAWMSTQNGQATMLFNNMQLLRQQLTLGVADTARKRLAIISRLEQMSAQLDDLTKPQAPVFRMTEADFLRDPDAGRESVTITQNFPQVRLNNNDAAAAAFDALDTERRRRGAQLGR